jgi:diguanylate cyclase (GGDEF)-like protein
MTSPTIERLPHGSLLRKYAFVFGALVVGSLLASGLIDLYFTYQENKSALIAVQREKADAAARRIEQYIGDIEQRIASTNPVKAGTDALAHRQTELEALSQVAAITEIALLDANGNERFRTSRVGPGALPQKRAWNDIVENVKSGKPYRSPVYFLYGAEPYMSIAMAVGAGEAGITVAEVDLEFLLEGISRIKVGKAGYAYAVDGTGKLIAHSDISLVMKQTNMAELPQVRAALDHASSQRVVSEGRDLGGRPVLTSYGLIPHLGWYVFVEQPQSEAFAPLYATVLRTGIVLLCGLVLALAVAIALVRRMVRPIHALQKGAMLIGSGNLEHRIDVRTGDELEELAQQFNHMARQLHASYASLEEKVRQRTEELETANRALEEVSITDPLTGMRNRRFLVQMLGADVSLVLRRYDDWLNGNGAVPRPSMDLIFFMIDIDHFKSVNDCYGHAAGDAVLSQLPQRLRGVFRESDYLIRWGGEEFLVVARATARGDAPLLAERIRAAVANEPFLLEDGKLLPKTCSVGFACFPFLPEKPHLMTWTQVTELADRALYLSKSRGRDAWHGIVAADRIDDPGLFERVVRDPEAAASAGSIYVFSRQTRHEAAMTLAWAVEPR